jgi:hypothetical protein
MQSHVTVSGFVYIRELVPHFPLWEFAIYRVVPFATWGKR